MCKSFGYWLQINYLLFLWISIYQQLKLPNIWDSKLNIKQSKCVTQMAVKFHNPELKLPPLQKYTIPLSTINKVLQFLKLSQIVMCKYTYKNYSNYSKIAENILLSSYPQERSINGQTTQHSQDNIWQALYCTQLFICNKIMEKNIINDEHE